MFTMPFLELAGLLIIVLFISAGIVLWMKSQKKKPNPMIQLLILVLLLVLTIGGMKWGGEALGIFPVSGKDDAGKNPYRQALILLQEPYSSYTSLNNVASVNRELLIERFLKMEQLDLGDLKLLVNNLRGMIQSAPATGQTGIYNMRMTSDIQARWETLRQELKKRAERSS